MPGYVLSSAQLRGSKEPNLSTGLSNRASSVWKLFGFVAALAVGLALAISHSGTARALVNQGLSGCGGDTTIQWAFN